MTAWVCPRCCGLVHGPMSATCVDTGAYAAHVARSAHDPFEVAAEQFAAARDEWKRRHDELFAAFTGHAPEGCPTAVREAALRWGREYDKRDVVRSRAVDNAEIARLRIYCTVLKADRDKAQKRELEAEGHRQVEWKRAERLYAECEARAEQNAELMREIDALKNGAKP